MMIEALAVVCSHARGGEPSIVYIITNNGGFPIRVWGMTLRRCQRRLAHRFTPMRVGLKSETRVRY